MEPIPSQKRRVYLSAKRKAVNLNGQVLLGRDEAHSSKASSRTTVVCRHLAIEYMMSAKKDKFLRHVADQESIKEYFSGGRLREANARYEEITSRATEKNSVVISAHFIPPCVSDLVSSMRNRNLTRSDFLIATANHAMALSLQLKGIRKDRICVSFYDPNWTSNHFRIECRNADELSRSSLPRFTLDNYRENDALFLTVHASDEIFDPDRSLAHLGLSNQSTGSQLYASAMNRALDRKDPSLLEKLIKKVKEEGYRAQRLKEILACKYAGIPCLYWALWKGHAQSVNAWVGAVRHFGNAGLLEQSDIFELLHALTKQVLGASAGFIHPMEEGDIETIKAFSEGVVNAADDGLLSREHVNALFGARSNFGYSGIYHLWEKGHVDGMKVIVDKLVRCFHGKHLEKADILKLLLAKPEESVGNFGASPWSKEDLAVPFEGALRPLRDHGILEKSEIKAIFEAVKLRYPKESIGSFLKEHLQNFRASSTSPATYADPSGSKITQTQNATTAAKTLRELLSIQGAPRASSSMAIR
jgi:hypothetical protein